jgi:citronellol/citronellal dehydrogenase
VQKAVKVIAETFGKIDILVNNASAIDLSPTLKISTKKFDLMTTVNTRGTFMLTKYCLPYLLNSP